MPKVSIDSYGNLRLPETFLRRRHSTPNGNYWLDEYEGDLILRARLPDVHKLYKGC